MRRRLVVPTVTLVLLVGGISAVFLATSVDSTDPRPGARKGPRRPPAGPFHDIAPRLRGLPGGVDDEVTARRLVDSVLERVQGSPRAAILAALRHADWGIQWAGLLAIPRYGPSDAALAESVERALGSDLVPVRRTAAEAAAYLGRREFALVEELLRTVAQDPVAAVRSAAVRTLARHTSDRVALVPLFEAALADEDDATRSAGAYGLAQIELQERLAPDVVARLRPVLVRSLRDSVTDVVVYAVMALGRAGPQAGPDVPVILTLLDDERALVRATATNALSSIGESALPHIEAALTGDRPRRLPHLVWALRQIGEPAYPYLVRALEHENALVRGLAAQKLWELGHEVDRAVDVLVALLKGTDLDATRVAVRALGRMGTEGAEAIPALKALRTHENALIRASVAAALERLAPKDG